MKYGEYVRQLRERRNLSCSEFCREMGLDPSFWSRIERGQAKPPEQPDFHYSVGNVLRCSRDEQDHLFAYAILLSSKNLLHPVTLERASTMVPILVSGLTGKNLNRSGVIRLSDLIRKEVE